MGLIAAVTLDDLSRWSRGHGLEIVLVATGSVLGARLVRWLAARWARRAERQAAAQGPTMAATEASKYTLALIQAGAWLAVGLVYFVAALLILERLNVPLTSLVAPATVAGVAVGFGAQRLVQDVLGGFFLFAERQYGFGDVVRIGNVGETTGMTGTVEEFTLRTTRLRTFNGELVTIPNGEIRQVMNLSRDWARVVLDIPLPPDADVDVVTEMLRSVGEDMAADDAWRELLLDVPSVIGVETIQLGFVQLRFVTRTLPAKQWEVGRELRRRVAVAFQQSGISVPTSLVAVNQPTIR